MACCGKTIRKAGSIVKGYANLARGRKYEFTDDRIRACHKCDEQTWMSAIEYTAWLLTHGIEVITNFTELERLPPLPKQEQSPSRRRLYCRLCKCYIPAKARVETATCSLGKWESDDRSQKSEVRSQSSLMIELGRVK